MGAGTFSITGIAGNIRLHENHRRRPSDASRTVPSCGTTDTYGQGHGDGHRRRQAAQGHDGVFSECDSIIVATDAGREGELIFRWIYSHLGCTKPFKRLWFSSLTDEAIRKGMADLREGYEYDSLYAAADSRAKADWLVGMNASRALAAVSGSANNSIGRVQTPTLAMICARFKENRNFVSTPYWQLHITLKQGEAHRLFIHPEHFGDKKAAETAYGRIIPGSAVTITKVERGTVFQQAPLLYDLTSLQKDCNIHHDLAGGNGRFRYLCPQNWNGGIICLLHLWAWEKKVSG
jgi:DNA topoisomerase IA